ncbi:MAG: glycoside hydrolase family 38 C-terminal domain-containing protein [Clostridia bacterium]|nr:glycoside hydrolase family 38 C-terminal domain-containing protein [Clostridia bacterium]
MQLHQLDKRIRKMLETLEEFSVIQSVPVEGVQIAPRGSDNWVDFVNGERWGSQDEEWFNFRFKAVTPENFKDQTVLHILTGREAEWEAVNPQIVVWVDGRIEQAFDTKHHALVLADEPKPGKAYDVLFEGYVPKLKGFQAPARMLIELKDVNTEVVGLCYDIKVPWEAACLSPEGDRDRECTLETLSQALNLLDLRNPQSDEFNASVKAARAFLKSEYYDKRKDMDVEAVADCIGHTHIDCAWLWDLYQTRHKAVRSFATMLKLMERYPDFKFMSSQPLLYKMVKEDQPELYERIKDAVRRGQWQPEGGMWVEADCNLSSGESLVRQFLHGQEFFQKEFGQRTRTLWLPDVFGYSAAMPQILKKSGVDYFMTSKLSWSEFNLSPYDTFQWKGIDGSEVLTHFTPSRDFGAETGDLSHFTTYNAMLNPNQMRGGWKRFQQKALDNHFIVSYGYGDGGGGSTDWMIENARRMSVPLPGTPVVHQTMPREFFEELEARVKDNPRLPKWSGELYLEYHRGTYTAMARNKRFNRKMELALRDAEFLCTYANQLCGFAYPASQLHDLWETVLTLQFHDILPGSSIKKVYDDALEMYTDAMEKVSAIKEQAMNAIAHELSGDVVAFNSLSMVRDDVIWFDAPENVTALRDADGAEYPVQFVEGKACAFVMDMQPMTAKPLYFVTGTPSDFKLDVSAKGFDTPFFEGTFDSAMRITSMVDKRNGRQLCKEGKALNSIVCYENRPHNYDAWDINIYYDQKQWDVTDVTGVEVISEGPVLTKLRVHYAFNHSTIDQDVVFYTAIDRVDFDTTVDWKEQHYMLKAHFPVDIFYNDATFDIQYGNVKRATHKNTSWDVARFEVCAHKWADVSEAGYGFSLMNDCKYGYSVDENSMALTLLKSSTNPNPDADQEVHHFTYSIMPHHGDWREAGTPLMAYMLNIPVMVARGKGQKAALPSFVDVDQENVLVEVVKQQLDGEDTILRLYECYGMRTDVTMTLNHKPESVKLANMLEDELADANVEGNQVKFTLKPYEIVTFKVK